MSDDSDLEKTEAASPRRLEQAREEGDVPRSRELGSFALMAVSAGGLWVMGESIVRAASSFLARCLELHRYDYTRAQDQWVYIGAQFTPLATVLGGLILMLILAALTPLALTRGAISFKPLEPDISRLFKLQGLTRMFSVEGLLELPRLLLKLALVGGVAWGLILHYRGEFMELPQQDLRAAMGDVMHVAGVAFLCMAAVMLLVAAVDVPLVLWQYARKHRMTKEEVRKEHRESEGDPHLKGRIRAMQRQAAQRRMMADVPKADVIVTNPTHYAVALRYSEKEGGAPRVLAKGADLVAAKIRELGTEHKIPILEAPPLARALYRHTEIGHQIPEALYAAVAEVLAYVYQLRRLHQVGGRAPVRPTDLPVPADMDPGPDPTNAGPEDAADDVTSNA
ncbi:flagellar biosynthesis protein FlhB [Ralstonia insidiosa]|jgi:flagellar biosynthetic protein FlhB|uniref:flagellar biosynthesis protein FlhB n=1 Tax=Ralstonia TaxID=48736 RepID=UPI0006648489|nr:flagellar biosynthesis protein FlhB [Ralstonia insidiosa]KMW46710.1 flagellar biosynthesis protein FlhB [Ralstonia sp. MD27]MBX3771314.1 flagellar type III secretion system protein FlhB [Ralstonia pickettii]NOZ14515.1 flagellar type III secretion system protein FlhB [Betaproteobacteria bacterium]MBA9855439.1 flagellar type III secretion system protein FlhB [Ralstonia insidiosa]MBA9869324.1 flagellar type III secretion system protein FlhB [Ralstonia insidiosa]